MINKKFLKFILIGIVNTIFSYLIFVGIFWFIPNKEITLTVSFIIAILFNYFTVSSYVFKNNINFKKLILFFGVYMILYVLNLIHLWVFVDYLKYNVYIAQFLTLFYLPVISFLLNDKYVFNPKRNL